MTLEAALSSHSIRNCPGTAGGGQSPHSLHSQGVRCAQSVGISGQHAAGIMARRRVATFATFCLCVCLLSRSVPAALQTTAGHPARIQPARQIHHDQMPCHTPRRPLYKLQILRHCACRGTSWM